MFFCVSIHGKQRTRKGAISRRNCGTLDGSKVCSHKKTSQPTHLKRRRRTKSSNTVVKLPLPGRFARNQAARGDKRPMVHHGRMLYVKGRDSRKVVMVTMQPRTTQKGAPSPPEDATTVRKALQIHVDAKSCVSATDSAKAGAAKLPVFLFIPMNILYDMLKTFLPTSIPMYLSVYRSSFFFLYVSIYLYTYLSIYLSVYLSIYLSIFILCLSL